MKVFHGSDTFIDIIDLSKSKPSRDFGRGFYVTQIYRQAEDMARRIAAWNNTTPVITEYNFDEFAFEDENLNILRFTAYNEQWLDFVIDNRKNRSRKLTHD
jgi:hypothetical protein